MGFNRISFYYACCFSVVLCCLFLLSFNAYAHKVVLKKSGKVVEGDLVRQDVNVIVIKSKGTEITFKKETLDLPKMEELNAGEANDPAITDQKAGEQTIELPVYTPYKPPPPKKPANQLAEELKKERKGNVKTITNEDLERKAGVDTEAIQSRLDKIVLEISNRKAVDPNDPQIQLLKEEAIKLEHQKDRKLCTDLASLIERNQTASRRLVEHRNDNLVRSALREMDDLQQRITALEAKIRQYGLDCSTNVN